MKLIGITGGKGGTGKSTVATAFAVELGKKHKVLLVDMDVDCPNDHLIINIERKELKTVYQRVPKWNYDKCTNCGLCGDVCKTNAIISIKDKKPIFIPAQCNGCGSCVITCPEKAISWNKKEIGKVYSGINYGIDFLSGELKISEPVSEFIVNSVNEIIELKKHNYDYIIIDTAAGTHCDVIAALEVCDYIYAVTEPTPLGEHDAELIIKLAITMNKPYDVILNRFEGTDSTITSMLNKFNKTIAFKIPYKKSILEQYSQGIPVEDESIKQITRRIQNES
jgi:MinD superfamily P-loop ATPase